MEVEKGWNEKKEPTVKTRSLWRMSDHQDRIMGVMLTLQGWLWRTETILSPLYKKRTWRDKSSALSSGFSNIFSQPCKNTAFLKHCTQTVSKAWWCFKYVHVHHGQCMLQSAKQYWAVLSVWQQVEGGQHQCQCDFFLTSEISVKLLCWWNPFTFSGRNSHYIGMSKNWVRPLEKVEQWDILTYHHEVSYDTSLDRDREDWGDLNEALQYLKGTYKKKRQQLFTWTDSDSTTGNS